MDHHDHRQHQLIKKRKKAQEKAQENAERIAGIAIILDKNTVSGLKGKSLLDQIKIFKDAGAPNLQGAIPKLAKDKRQALVDAVELYEKGEWVTDKAEDWEELEESGCEEFDFEGIVDTSDSSDSDAE